METEPDLETATPDPTVVNPVEPSADPPIPRGERDLAHAPVVLAVRDLRKRYGAIEAVKGVGFEIRSGETYGLLGPNGAGKTTTISMVCGLLARDAGSVTLDGVAIDVGEVAAKRGIGYVPQELAIYPDLTRAREPPVLRPAVRASAARPSRRGSARCWSSPASRERADDRVEHYSGGMQRRLNIGIGLLHRPRLLLLDEPTVGVDPQSRNAILESIDALGSQGMAILYTTHYIEEAERLCDRVGIIDGGEIRAEGTRKELVALIGEREQVRLSLTGDVLAAARAAGAVPGVASAGARGDMVEVLAGDAGAGPAAGARRRSRRAGAQVRGVELVQPNLEAVFLHLTGRALRDTD